MNVHSVNLSVASTRLISKLQKNKPFSTLLETAPESRTASTSPNQQFLATSRCRIVHPNAQNRPNAIFLIQIDPTTSPRVHGHSQPDRPPTFAPLSHCEERPQQCHP